MAATLRCLTGPRRGTAPRLTLALAVAMGMLALLAGRSESADAAANVPTSFVGMSGDGPLFGGPGVDLDHELGVMAKSGVGRARVVFDWRAAQPYRSFADVPAAELPRFTNVHGVPTDWSATDRIVGAASAQGLTVLPVILGVPGWDGRNRSSGQPTPRAPKPFASFAAALVERYGPTGDYWFGPTFAERRPIREWQLWNEPNIPFYWDQPFAKSFTALLKPAYRAIKAADSGARVVLPGLTNKSWQSLASLYSAGAKKYFDAVAVHPYTKKVNGLIPILNRVDRVMRDRKDRAKRMLVTEFSWPSAKGKVPPLDFNEVTESQQAARVRDALNLLASNRKRLHIESAYWYTWISRDSGDYYFDYAGLRATNGGLHNKPAYGAFKRTALKLEGR